MSTAPPYLHGGWTLEDLDTLPDDGQRYELLDGGLVVTPPPTQRRWPLEHPRADDRNPVGPADVDLVVEVVSQTTRRTDRFAKPGEYAEAGIALFWRLETEPVLVLHPFVLGSAGYEPLAPVRDQGSVPVPWGVLVIDLSGLGD